MPFSITQKQAVLLMSHFFNARIEEKYNRLTEELSPDLYDVSLLLNLNDKEEAKTIPSYIHLCVYDSNDLNSLGYTPIFESLLPGSCHFPVLHFYKDNPVFPYYWFIEYDVEFTAPWSELLNAYNKDQTDYIVPFLAKYDVTKSRYWEWWTTGNNSGFPLTESIRAFHPICRYSNAALNCIDKHQCKGHSAHSEILIPTCLAHAGMSMKMFDAQYFIKERGFTSFRYRPTFSSDEFAQKRIHGKLFHPVKI